MIIIVKNLAWYHAELSRIGRAKFLTMVSMHGNVIRIMIIDESKIHMHNAHFLRSIVLNKIMQELLQT